MKTTNWIWLGIAGAGIALFLSKKSGGQSSCTPNWQCQEWSPCQNPGNGWRQVRECRDLNECGLSGNPSPDENWKVETRTCVPPQTASVPVAELVLQVENDNTGKKRITWNIYISNPTSQEVNFDTVITIDAKILGDAYLAIGNIPANVTLRQAAIGTYTGFYAGETHTVCITPYHSLAPWTGQCKTVVV